MFRTGCVARLLGRMPPSLRHDLQRPGAAAPPRLSIGVPVYNGERTLPAALDSLLGQTFTDFELIISDNASTDRTPEICAEYARRDRRIVVERQPRNMGPGPNFEVVLTRSRGDYFMWAAADDLWEPDFAAANLAMLESDPRLVASMCRVESPGFEPGTFALVGTPSENVARFLGRPGLNARLYGVFRREALLSALPIETFVGSDWWLVLKVLKRGGFAEVDRVLFRKSGGGISDDFAALLRLNKTRLGRLFPMGELTWRVVRDRSLPAHATLVLLVLRHFLGGTKAAVEFHLRRMFRALSVRQPRRASA